MSEKAKKALWLAITAVLAGIASLWSHYYFNDNEMTGKFVYYFALVLLVSVSVICAGEFLRAKFTCGKVKYAIVALIIDLIEVIPLPFCGQYFPMDTAISFSTSWKHTALIFIVILLVVAAFNFLKKRYTLKLSVRIERKT